MKLDIYLNYRGNCEQAFQFYEQHLGGRITGISRHRDAPNPNIPADWQAAVLQTIGGISAVRRRHKGRYQPLPGASALARCRLEPTRPKGTTRN